MSERPIIFSATMVQAILRDGKTQTRRVCKFTSAGYLKEPGKNRRWHKADPDAILACPYGQPGDRLWVRETFARCPDDFRPRGVIYKADGMPDAGYVFTGEWRPSIYMPRWASRILLEVTEVRVQRVQEITEGDSRAEGISDGGCLNCGNPEPCKCQSPKPDARDAFVRLWDSINAKRGFGWIVNPWVWAVSFKRVS